MITTFGKMPDEMPDGFLTAVNFPVLAMLDKKTGDGRLLQSSGAATRDLPLPILGQFKLSAGGHDGADVTGALFEVTVDPDKGVMSGRGYLLDDEYGRRHARLIKTKAMRGNSVDLADVEASFEYDEHSDSRIVKFSKYRLAATTGVAKPAFAEAYAELSDEEVMASLGDEELVCEPEEWSVSIILPDDEEEIVASASAVQDFDSFYIPEADKPQKIIVDADNKVYGHLGLWESCHDGIAARCVRIPRQADNYASFNKPGVLTDRGIVETGPIFAYGGHRPSNGVDSLEDAYGGIENAWADVRITEGRFGPWISGIVRPGIHDDVIYAARASRISGHWVGGKLKAIVSVNAEGFDVPGSGFAASDFQFVTSDEGVAELVASFPSCSEMAANVSLVPPVGAQREARRGLQWVADGHAGDGLEPATVARARSMANGEVRSPETVRRMRDFFNRHQSDKQATGWRPGETGYPSPGRVAWALWGGNTGWSWAKRTSDRLDANSAIGDEMEIKVIIGGEEKDDDEGEMEGACPKATQDIAVNLENRQEAIDIATYGPLNPEDSNEAFWTAKAERWSVTIDEVKKSLCGNCAAFIQTPVMLDCINKGLGGEGEATVEAADLGYCEIFDFKCAALRTCDAWITGGPITEDSESEDSGMPDMAAQPDDATTATTEPVAVSDDVATILVRLMTDE